MVGVGQETAAAEYLNGYLEENDEVPSISLDCALRAARLIEEMDKMDLKKRKGAS